jgi:hypothetical protein
MTGKPRMPNEKNSLLPFFFINSMRLGKSNEHIEEVFE